MRAREQVQVSIADYVGTIILSRPPHNFVNVELMAALVDCLQDLDTDEDCRVIVLGTDGKNFCAGADFSGIETGMGFVDSAKLYTQAMRLFDTRKPIVAAVQGAAVGAGAGLALTADFRIACASTRFVFNFNSLGFHPGFGLSYTLPRLVGTQIAARLFYTGDRVSGEEALAIGLADELAPEGEVRQRAQALALRIAQAAPRAVESTRETLRQGFAKDVRAFNAREQELQQVQFASEDFREGIKAAAERRLPVFRGT